VQRAGHMSHGGIADVDSGIGIEPEPLVWGILGASKRVTNKWPLKNCHAEDSYDVAVSEDAAKRAQDTRPRSPRQPFPVHSLTTTREVKLRPNG
jgi:hypothetical protein